MKFSLLLLLIAIYSTTLQADNNQRYVDFYREYQKQRLLVVPAKVAAQIRQDQMLAKQDIQADLTPLKKYYLADSWPGMLECYKYKSCRGYMLLTLHDWSLREVIPTRFDDQSGWIKIYYSGTQVNGEKGSGYVTLHKKPAGLKIGMSCWISTQLNKSGKGCR